MRYLVVDNTDINTELTCFDDLDEAKEFAVEATEQSTEELGGEVYLYELTNERKPDLITYWMNGKEQIRGAW